MHSLCFRIEKKSTKMMIDNKIVFPEYISKSLFETALRNGFDSPNIFITDLKLSMGSNTGENYCSEIYRAVIEYTDAVGKPNCKISLIVKAMPYTEARGPVLEDLQVFDKEVKMYTETLPKIAKTLNNEYFNAKYFSFTFTALFS